MKVEETPDPFLVGREVPSLKWREELGSGCESDIGGGEGGGWLGDLKVKEGGGREEKKGSRVEYLWLKRRMSQFLSTSCIQVAGGVSPILACLSASRLNTCSSFSFIIISTPPSPPFSLVPANALECQVNTAGFEITPSLSVLFHLS